MSKKAIEIKEKRCKTCCSLLPASSFHVGNGYLKPNCKACTKQIWHKYYTDNKTKLQLDCLNYSRNNPEVGRKWRSRNKHRIKKYNAKIRSTPEGLLNSRMCSTVYKALKKNKAGRRWNTILDYSVTDLKNHLESKFTDGMSWEIFDKGRIHLDHIKPRVLFKFTSEEDDEFKKCWALENLQPLWAIDNFKKGKKYHEISKCI